MKALFIMFDQAHKEDLVNQLDKLMIRGFTLWEDVHGRGSHGGDPHYGNHAWPSLNNAVMTVVEAEKVASLKESLKQLDEESPQLGLRVFVWTIDDTY